MNPSEKPRESRPPGELREVRFSLGELLDQVAEERRSGSFGAEKMHQTDVRRVFRKKGGRSRG